MSSFLLWIIRYPFLFDYFVIFTAVCIFTLGYFSILYEIKSPLFQLDPININSEMVSWELFQAYRSCVLLPWTGHSLLSIPFPIALRTVCLTLTFDVIFLYSKILFLIIYIYMCLGRDIYTSVLPRFNIPGACQGQRYWISMELELIQAWVPSHPRVLGIKFGPSSKAIKALNCRGISSVPFWIFFNGFKPTQSTKVILSKFVNGFLGFILFLLGLFLFISW